MRATSTTFILLAKDLLSLPFAAVQDPSRYTAVTVSSAGERDVFILEAKVITTPKDKHHSVAVIDSWKFTLNDVVAYLLNSGEAIDPQSKLTGHALGGQLTVSAVFTPNLTPQTETEAPDVEPAVAVAAKPGFFSKLFGLG